MPDSHIELRAIFRFRRQKSTQERRLPHFHMPSCVLMRRYASCAISFSEEIQRDAPHFPRRRHASILPPSCQPSPPRLFSISFAVYVSISRLLLATFRALFANRAPKMPMMADFPRSRRYRRDRHSVAPPSDAARLARYYADYATADIERHAFQHARR